MVVEKPAFCFTLKLRSTKFAWIGMKDPKEEAQLCRMRDDLTKEILAWRVKLRRGRLKLFIIHSLVGMNIQHILSYEPDGPNISLFENLC